MFAFLVILTLVWLVLGAIFWTRLTRLAGEVSFLRTALDQAHRRIRALEECEASATPESSPAPSVSEPSPAPATPTQPPPVPVLHSAPAPQPPPLPTLPEAAAPAFAHSTAPAIPARPKGSSKDTLARNLRFEQFVGAKLFAWLGGLALFFAAALGLKYSFDHDLLPTWLRATAGFTLGCGLLVGGGLLNRRTYPHTATTLWGTGIVILYAVAYACRSIYGFPVFTSSVTFGLMVVITSIAFGLAVRFDTQVVAILGMLGGFLTPILVSSGRDQAVALFTYIAILDVGLIAVASRRGWAHLAFLGALGTVLFQLGWHVAAFQSEKIRIAQTQMTLFPVLFAVALTWATRRNQSNLWMSAAAGISAITTLILSFFLAGSHAGVSTDPSKWCVALLTADAALCWIGWIRSRERWWEPVGGSLVFLTLSAWTLARLTPETLWWGLGLMLAFALLHAATPVAWRRFRSDSGFTLSAWHQIAPALGILLALLVVIRELPVGPGYWAVILALDLIAVGVAVAVGGIVGLLLVLVLSLASAGVWLGLPTGAGVDLAESLFVIGTFALFFVGASTWFVFRSKPASTPDLTRWMPSLSALLPFTLLLLVIARILPANPTPVFGLAGLLSITLLILHRWQRIPSLPAIALVGSLLVQSLWLVTAPQSASPRTAILWISAFFLLFLFQPLALRMPLVEGRVAWAVAGLAGPVQLLLLQWIVRKTWNLDLPGLIPLPFLLLAGLVFEQVRRGNPVETPGRLPALAALGGGCLFLTTAILPLQFKQQWLTIAFGLEGAALCALFHRLPHPGIRGTGVMLLLVAAGRLFLHPIVFGNAPRPDSAWNWFLYAFAIVIAAQFIAARLLAPPRDIVLGSRIPPILIVTGTLLLFLLLNLEIATVFGTGPTLSWEFSGNFARDLAYSIGWSLFAFLLLVAGFISSNRPTRYAGLALLGITLLKLFLHDLARLGPLHRIGAFAGVAVVAIVASFLYQRFQGRETSTQAQNP